MQKFDKSIRAATNDYFNNRLVGRLFLRLIKKYIYIYIRDGSRFSNIRLVNLIIEYRLGYAIIF